MVFLRLTVKVQPPDYSLNRDDASDLPNNPGTASPKPVSFLVVLDNPEEVALGTLAGLIQKQWKTLRPNSKWVRTVQILCSVLCFD